MTASITQYQTFNKYVGDGTIDLDTDTFKVTLHTSSYTPNAATQTVYADLTNELSTANGYTNGGVALASVTWTQSTVTMKWDAADATWAASGGSIVARYAVIRKVGTANSITDPLVAWVLLDTSPADVTTTTGNSLNLVWNASGIFTSVQT